MKNTLVWFKFYPNLFSGFQLKTCQYWFKWWIGAEQATGQPRWINMNMNKWLTFCWSQFFWMKIFVFRQNRNKFLRVQRKVKHGNFKQYLVMTQFNDAYVCHKSPERYGVDYECVILQHIMTIDISSRAFPVRMLSGEPEDFAENKSILLQVMAWCRQKSSSASMLIEIDVAKCCHWATMG